MFSVPLDLLLAPLFPLASGGESSTVKFARTFGDPLGNSRCMDGAHRWQTPKKYKPAHAHTSAQMYIEKKKSVTDIHHCCYLSVPWMIEAYIRERFNNPDYALLL